MTAQIEISNLYYRPASLPPEQPDILRGISLRIEEGAFIAVVGENGSGKTTLIKHINGLLLPSKGRVCVEGMDTKDPQNVRSLRAKVGLVFQNPAYQIVASTVEEDIAFGLENLNLASKTIQLIVSEQLISAGLFEEASHPPHLLSDGQIQGLALAGVLARQPSVILFDEPTSMLDPLSRSNLITRILDLKQKGITIIYVTHHMEEAVKADRVIVMKQGQVLLEGSPHEIFVKNDILYEIGLEVPATLKIAKGFRSLGWGIPPSVITPDALIKALPKYNGHASVSQVNPFIEPAEKIINFCDVEYTYMAGSPLAKAALRGVNLDIFGQSVHGIAGSNGSGKSTLLQHINGILRPSNGHLSVGQFVLENNETSLREIIEHVGLVFQNPETQFFEVFVGDEVAYGPKQFNMGDLRERVRSAMALVSLDFETYKDRRLETLSGGEKRKVALSSTLILDQDILLFDEPTAGMDPHARDDLLTLFRHLKDQGKTIVIASHRMEELAEVTNQLSIMRDGQVEKTGPSHDILNSENLKQAGLEPPLAVCISKQLIKNGWPIAGKNTTTAKRLIRTIQEVTQ
ncbi:MAG: energy-coupling factor transporter ATPase [Chloroflexota bacterium]|nr:energy-coupling factor transporter ATPase [Chloroflexota bacterium]